MGFHSLTPCFGRWGSSWDSHRRVLEVWMCMCLSASLALPLSLSQIVSWSLHVLTLHEVPIEPQSLSDGPWIFRYFKRTSLNQTYIQVCLAHGYKHLGLGELFILQKQTTITTHTNDNTTHTHTHINTILLSIAFTCSILVQSFPLDTRLQRARLQSSPLSKSCRLLERA